MSNGMTAVLHERENWGLGEPEHCQQEREREAEAGRWADPRDGRQSRGHSRTQQPPIPLLLVPSVKWEVSVPI